ncbi:MAG: AAA family ATPase [Nitrospirota bacterium]
MREAGRTLVRSLMDPARYGHPVGRIELVETHISWVLLTGDYAYKIKKPVNLGFLDFSTPAKRRRFCREELRLNRRLAPQLYLDVVPITGSPASPRWGGRGRPLDFAVKMRQFPFGAQLDRVAARGELQAEQIDGLAGTLASFHDAAPVAPAGSRFGSPRLIGRAVGDNFAQMRRCLASADRRRRHRRLQAWSQADLAEHDDAFRARKTRGFVRECHGDLHLANMILWDGSIVPFDCLEFNQELRWIDVMSDVAFACMDLESRGHAGLAHRLLNGYLEAGGDYDGLAVFRTYRVYRALVRAKVACIRGRQTRPADPARRALRRELEHYVELAERWTRPSRPYMVIMRGVSGSGKTVLSQRLVEACGAVRVRSDVERKRLFGLAPLARSGAALARRLYSGAVSRRTYERLAGLAGLILRAGYPVIVDATFLWRSGRDEMRRVAEQQGAPWVILDLHAPAPVLRERVLRREAERHDASEAGLAVLERQLAADEPLSEAERPHALTVPTGEEVDLPRLVAAMARAARN